MLEIAGDLARWIDEERDFAVATVTAVDGSAPRPVGAALAVASDGTVVGSVSGGCVEGAVYDLCRQALQDGQVSGESFGYSDDDAFAVGLTCGGSIDVLVTPVRKADAARAVVASAVAVAARGVATAVVRVARGPADLLGHALLVRPDGSHEGGFHGRPGLTPAAVAAARAALAAGRTGTVVVGEDGSYCGVPITLLVETSVPAPRMIVFGATDFASALVPAGKLLGYHVTVCDARPVFATPARFPAADEVVAAWPDRYLASTRTDDRTALCVLTHDAKFDIPLLQLALRLPVAYVGAMGSRRTHADRHRRLLAAGLSELELARLRSPIGLDLGARTPEETAVSIVAEIIALRHGGSGTPLQLSSGPIHQEPATLPPQPVSS
ncbi:XdhC family protein [Streptomyces sp. NPDC048521]|uniref:XdhC family protein n=1 Tax=Streptomyces sp. NPDC048521 TaxID=3365566 RepID=UPI003716D398